MDKKVEELANSVKNETVNDLLTFLNTNYKSTTKDKFVWNFDIITDSIAQPLLITTASTPIIIHKNNETYFSFDGRTLFFTKNYSEFYVFMPFDIKDACLYKLTKKTPTGSKCVIVTLDTQNKLTYADIKNHSIHETKTIISRNVIQMVEKNNELYYLSFKKDNYYVNIVIEDNGVLKPKIIVQNLTSKYEMLIFLTSKSLFLYSDNHIIPLSGKKPSFKGEGIYEVSNMFVIYTKVVFGVRLILCDDNFVIKNELMIETTNFVVKIHSLDSFLCCRIGNRIYFIKVDKKDIFIVKEIECPNNLLDFTVRFTDKNKITLCYLIQTINRRNFSSSGINKNFEQNKQENENFKSKIFNTDENKEEENNLKLNNFSSCSKYFHNVFDIPKPKIDDQIYNPLTSSVENNLESDNINSVRHFNGHNNSCDLKEQNYPFANTNLKKSADTEYDKKEKDMNILQFSKTLNKDENCIKSNIYDNTENFNINVLKEYFNDLFKQFETVFYEKDTHYLKKFQELQENIIDKVKTSFQDVVKTEMTLLENKLIYYVDNKIANITNKDLNEDKILDFTKDLICDNLLPVVEASMDEMRVQVLSTISEFKDPEYLFEIRSALSNLSVYNEISELEKSIKASNYDKAVEIVLKGTFRDLEDFIKLVDMKYLESVSSNNLMGLLEKSVLLSADNYKDFFDDLIYNSLTFIEPENLSDEELRTLIIILSQIKDSEILLSKCNNPIFVLVDFLNFKIPKILFKRQKSLKN